MFDIQKGSQIVLYGYSQFDTVKDKYGEMQKLGYEMLGYIDQNAEMLRKRMQIPCWTIENFPHNAESRKAIIVILLLQNGRKHEEVAKNLYDSGFEKILFLPHSLNTACQKEMFQKYNFFLKNEFDVLKAIPERKDMGAEKIQTEDGILRRGEKNLTVTVPLEILFTYASEDGKEENICFSKPYCQLFDVLEGKTFACNQYYEFMGADTKEKQEKLLLDRMELYCFWERYRHLDMNYFIDAAPIVSWNEKGYFNIIDGHHRAMYQCSKGYRKIPVSMTYDDYRCWKSIVSKEDYENLKRRSIPIPHPNFLEENTVYEGHWQKVIRYLYKIGYGSQYRLVEIDNYLGYYASVFQRIVKGASLVVLDNESDITLCRVAQGCNHQKLNIVEMNEIELSEKDILFLKISENKKNKMLQIIQNFSGSHLIVELQEKDSEVLLKKISSIFAGKIERICKFYKKDAYLICAWEKEY